jgi:hypothetical protein
VKTRRERERGCGKKQTEPQALDGKRQKEVWDESTGSKTCPKKNGERDRVSEPPRPPQKNDSCYFFLGGEMLATRFKNIHIDLLAHRNRLNLFENTPNIKVLGSISDKRAWFKGWLSIKKYDYVIVFNYGNDQTNIVRFALRAGKKVIASSTKSQKLNAQLFQCIPRKEKTHFKK